MSSLRWIAPVAALAALGACSMSYSGPTATESRNIADFDGVSAGAGVNVILKQGPFAVSVKGPEGKLDQIKIEKDGSVLRITQESSSGFWFGWSGSSEVTVTAPAYTSLKASAGADIDGENLQFDALDVSISAGGDTNLSGSCKSITIDASAGADFDGKDLKCETAEANGSAGSDIEIFVSGTATGNASAGADITFYGNPTTVNRHTSAGGDVNVES